MTKKPMNRRNFFLSGSALLALGACGTVTVQQEVTVRRVSKYTVPDWEDHFPSLEKGAILCDTSQYRLFYWGEDGEFRTYPTSIARRDDLIVRGRTKVTRKVHGPSWTPTPNMRRENPTLPRYVRPFDPLNPLGTHALYVEFPYIRIHGTHRNDKIGRASSSGCIGLYNKHIEELYSLVQVGTQVVII